MLKVDNVCVWGFQHAIRGMRNPMNSWSNSDSTFDNGQLVELGDNDRNLMCQLYKSGSSHRKFMRQIFVSVDVTAPLYWWKEADQYKIGTVTDSCSTMHRIHSKEFDMDDFSCEHLNEQSLCIFRNVIHSLNLSRMMYLKSSDKDWWWQMIQQLPSSYNQLRTWTFDYETASQMIVQRSSHKLDEWITLVNVLADLPHLGEIMDIVK